MQEKKKAHKSPIKSQLLELKLLLFTTASYVLIKWQLLIRVLINLLISNRRGAEHLPAMLTIP